MEMPFSSLGVDGKQLAYGRKIEAEHDKVIKYLLLTANPDLADAELNRLVVLARDLIAKTHLAEFGNYYLPYLKDAEAAMKAALKSSDKKEEGLTLEVSGLKALLAEAGDRWIHWWLLENGQVEETEGGTHYRYVAGLPKEEAIRKFKIDEKVYDELRKASDNDQEPPADAVEALLQHNIRMSFYMARKEFGIESKTLDDITLERVQRNLPQEAQSRAKEVVWDAPFDSSKAPISVPMSTFVAAASMRDLGGVRDIGGLAQFREDDHPGPFESEKMFNQIQHGSRVTILTPHGSKLTGRATIRNDRDGVWVINLGGKFGTPGIATPDNVIAVRGGLKEEKNFSINKWSSK